MTKNVSRKERRRDTLLAHCLARAAVGELGGRERAEELVGARAERLSKWGGIRLGVKATPKASRVAGFVILWAVAMQDEDRSDYSITEYQRYWNEGERQAYRLQKEFRELWPELETPNELARQVIRQLDERQRSKREIAGLSSVLRVTA